MPKAFRGLSFDNLRAAESVLTLVLAIESLLEPDAPGVDGVGGMTPGVFAPLTGVSPGLL
jgi:hypothetical protein